VCFSPFDRHRRRRSLTRATSKRPPAYNITKTASRLSRDMAALQSTSTAWRATRHLTSRIQTSSLSLSHLRVGLGAASSSTYDDESCWRRCTFLSFFPFLLSFLPSFFLSFSLPTRPQPLPLPLPVSAAASEVPTFYAEVPGLLRVWIDSLMHALFSLSFSFPFASPFPFPFICIVPLLCPLLRR
jgi:hypothetical protein